MFSYTFNPLKNLTPALALSLISSQGHYQACTLPASDYLVRGPVGLHHSEVSKCTGTTFSFKYLLISIL